ncbi:hypothetical protein [Bacillus sp. AK031]
MRDRLMKRIAGFLLIIAAAIGGYGYYYTTQYDVELDDRSVQTGVKTFLQRGESGIDPELIEVVQIADTSSRIAMFQLKNGNMGYAHLIRGFNNKYKIDHAGYGTNTVTYESVETNKGLYGMLLGGNRELEIQHIKADLIHEDFSFTADVSGERIITQFIKLPEDLSIPFPAELTFFNEDNQIIR